MKKKIFTGFIFAFCLCNISIGQTVLFDNIDSSKIAFAHIISRNGKLIATSDCNGMIMIECKNLIDTLIIQHVSYDNLEMSLNDLHGRDTIYLNRKELFIPEIIVHSVNYEVVVLKGYYRSYELDNNVPKYYTDGIVEYYIPVGDEKKMKMVLLECRSYGNFELIQKEKQRTNMVVMRLAGVPNIYSNTILNALEKEYSTHNLSTSCLEIRKDSSRVGEIKYDKKLNIIQLSIDLMAPSEDNTKTLFNYTSQIINNELIEQYPYMELSELSVNDLLRRQRHRKIFFKHKNDKDFIELDGIDELYIFSKYYISDDEFKKVKSSSYAFPESTSYSGEYWNNLEQYNIPNLNKNIEELIGSFLKKY